MGSSERILYLVKKRATVDYPHIIVETYSPPYKPKFSDEDNKAIFIMKKKQDIYETLVAKLDAMLQQSVFPAEIVDMTIKQVKSIYRIYANVLFTNTIMRPKPQLPAMTESCWLRTCIQKALALCHLFLKLIYRHDNYYYYKNKSSCPRIGFYKNRWQSGKSDKSFSLLRTKSVSTPYHLRTCSDK